MSTSRRLPWGQRLRAAASILTGGAVAAGRFGPFVSSRDWNNRFTAADDPAVTSDTALQVSTVYACVNILSDTVAQLPVGVFKKEGERRVPQPDHPVSRLLAGNVNDYTGRRGLVRTGETSRQLRGNGYVQIERDNGAPVGLWPLNADATAPRRTEGGRLIYQTSVAGETQTLEPTDILHVRGLSLDGLVGVSPIDAARHAIALAMYTESFGSKFFKNDGRSGGYILQSAETNARSKKERQDSLSSGGSEGQGGHANAHKPKILDPGAKYIPVTIAPEEAQFLQTRGFQVEEVARLYRVPLVLIGHLEKTSSWGTGVEQLMIGFAQWTIAPLAMDWEQELTAKLLSEEERAQGYYCRMDMRGIMRGASADRAAFYASAIQNNWMLPAEVRAREELDPLPDGDAPVRPQTAQPTNDNGVS
ncbi:phage portal protein [alpha proteobacterium U9-1i]|nr:phage portal protein [alpha proteobacterium U9-1i]